MDGWCFYCTAEKVSRQDYSQVSHAVTTHNGTLLCATHALSTLTKIQDAEDKVEELVKAFDKK